MPTHNTERWVAKTLESVLAHQGDVDLEILAVDDHSTDGTWDILTRYAARDARVRPLRSPGAGSSAARNAGVAAANGRYLAFADSDDIVAPGAYQALVGSLEASGSDVALGEYRVFSDDPADAVLNTPALADATYPSLEDAPELIRRDTLWDAVYRREAWDKQGIQARPGAIRCNDVVPKATALLTARGIDSVGRTVYYYRTGGGANVMTQRAVTAAGLRSHLFEFRERARLITALGSKRILDVAAAHFVDAGFGHLTDFAATGAPTSEEAHELRALARDALSAHGVSPARRAASRHGLHELDKLAIWAAIVHIPWPAGLAAGRARFAKRAAKRAIVAAATRVFGRRP